MANTEQLNIVFNASMDINNVEKQIGKMQKALSNVKLPGKLGESLQNSLSNIGNLIKKYQDQLDKGFESKKDVTNITQLGKQIDAEMARISKIVITKDKNPLILHPLSFQTQV